MKLETFKWLYQRISTPLILILSFWLIYNAYQIQNYNYEIITAFFKKDLNLFFFIIFIFLSLFHTAIEVFHSVNDYFADSQTEAILKTVIKSLYTLVLLSIFFFMINFIFL